MESDDRSVQGAAKAGAGTATGNASQYGNTAGQVGGTLIPTLTQQATNPQGLSPTDLNNELVAGEQAAGGATGAINDKAALTAERTNNTGNLSALMDQAARRQGQTLSQNALGVQSQNANLKQQQQQSALKGLEGMYGTDVGAQLKSMGISDEDLNTALSAGKSGWLQQGLGVAGTLSGMGLGAAKVAMGQ